MGYNDVIKSNAFVLFSQGYSYRAIAEMMRTNPGCEKLTHGTVKSWAETPDEKGHTWNERKQEVIALMRKKESDIAVKSQAELLESSQKALTTIMDEILSGALEFKTKDAAVYAFKALAEWQGRVIAEGKQITIEEQVEILFESMYEIPEVASVLSSHEKRIMESWKVKALERLKKKR
jgi:transposase